jgi:hypothetical protein
MTDRAHSARIYDYLLGGTTNYQPDRDAAEAALAAWPSLRRTAAVQRGFMHRTARAIAEAGVIQFLDIGTGIPTEPNLRQIVNEVCPDSRVVYVDNDPSRTRPRSRRDPARSPTSRATPPTCTASSPRRRSGRRWT